MNNDIFTAEEISPGKSIRRGWNTRVAWAIILLVTAWMFSQVLSKDAKSEKTSASKADMKIVSMQSKTIVGMQQFEIPVTGAIDDIPVGSLEQRYAMVLLKNELVDAESATELYLKINKLVREKNYRPTVSQLRLGKIVGSLLIEYRKEQWDSSVLPVDDRKFLIEQTGWIGRLGLTPVNSPNTEGRKQLIADAIASSIKIAVLYSIIGLGFLFGLATIVSLSVYLAARRPISKMMSQEQRSAVYLETFAIWIVLFFVVAPFLAALMINSLNLTKLAWINVVQLGVFFGSLIVLAWPVGRGLTFKQVREDIGWTCRNPIREVLAGFASYLAMVPVMAGILLLYAIISSQIMKSNSESFESTGSGGHPIVDHIATGDYSIWITVALLAVVAAPIVEETMFRGVFYRYLKDASRGRKFIISVAFACLVNGLIFASLHPQGLVGIPVLTTIAIGMSLARQWRDSLVASITMHAINNGFVTLILFTSF